MSARPSLFNRNRVILALISLVFSWHIGSYCRGVMMASIDFACGHYEKMGWGLPFLWTEDYAPG